MSQTKKEIEELFRSRLECGAFIDDAGLYRPPQLCESIFNSQRHPVAHAAIVTAKFAIDQAKVSVPWLIAPHAYQSKDNRSLDTPVHYSICREVLARAAETDTWSEINVLFGFLRPLPDKSIVFNQRKTDVVSFDTHQDQLAELTHRMPEVILCLGKTTIMQMGTIQQSQRTAITI